MKRIFLFFSFVSAFTLFINAQLNGEGFYRIRNCAAVNNYLTVVYDTINAQHIVGSASNMLSPSGRDAAMTRAETLLKKDIIVINSTARFTDPGSVIYLKKKNNNTKTEFDLLSQGVGVLYMTTAKFHGTNSGDIPINGSYAKIQETETGSGKYKAGITITGKYSFISFSLTRYLGDNNNSLSLSKTATEDKYYWYVEPINSTNYFAAAPLENLTQKKNNTDCYYTSIRTAFSYTVPTNANNKVRAYNVTALPETPGELATLEEVTTVNAGIPVIIESTSLDSENNKLEPCTPVAYLEASNSGSCSITPHDYNNSNSNIILYNNYGRHGHDQYTSQYHASFTGWLPTGDNIGFFKNKYPWNTSNVIYKLGIKDGAVGFWDKVGYLEQVSGNEAYSPVQCQLFPVEKELADIAEDGKENISYDVIDNYLYGVKVVNGKLYAKDYGKFRYPDEKADDAIDGMSKFYGYSEDYDQSNWVALDVADASSYVNKDLHVIGKLVNRQNPEIKVAKIEKVTPIVSSYEFNTYCPASFMGSQTSTINGKSYFFVMPKPQELVHVNWAIYGGNNKFYVNKPGNGINSAQIKGGFIADGALLPDGKTMDDFVVGNAYEFDAVVKVNEVSAGPSLLDEPYTDGGVSNLYTVYPFGNISDTPTGVERLDNGAQVVNVKYYNMMGVESDVPFQGVNIVVTTYDNGTRTTHKMFK